MNKFPQYLVRASLVALSIALLGGLWLVWQTIEESRALERHNRELQASLEASRIRIENFCDYPSDALCRMDERTGNVAGVMNEFLQGTQKTPQDEAPFDAAKTLANAMNPASKAMDTVKKVAEAQALVAAEVKPVSPAPSAANQAHAPEKPIPASDKSSEPKGIETADMKKAVTSPAKSVEELSKSSKQRKEVTKIVKAQAETDSVKSAEKPAAVQSQDASPAEKAEEKTGPATDDAIIPERSYLHEVSGKLSTILPDDKPAEDKKGRSKKGSKKSRENAASKKLHAKHAATASVTKDSEGKVVRRTPAKILKQNTNEVRKSWSRVEDDGGIFSFTITGSGATLPAEGALKAGPWRYELVLDGRWEVRAHSGIDNRLVSFMTTATRDGNTVLTFLLKSKPYRCSLHRPDSRTATLRIR